MKDALIVADDSSIIKNIIEKSIDSNIVVLKANNGKEAIDYLISNSEYNIIGILLDLNMPEYDGFMVLDYFKKYNLFSSIPVYIISGDDSKDTINRAFTYNIVDLLSKPFSKDNINNIIQRMLDLKR